MVLKNFNYKVLFFLNYENSFVLPMEYMVEVDIFIVHLYGICKEKTFET